MPLFLKVHYIVRLLSELLYAVPTSRNFFFYKIKTTQHHFIIYTEQCTIPLYIKSFYNHMTERKMGNEHNLTQHYKLL